jgi:hypothetical protein
VIASRNFALQGESTSMDEYTVPPYADRPQPAPRRRTAAPRWLVIGGLGIAFALALGVGVLIGSSVLPSFANGDVPAAPGHGAFGQFGQFGAAGFDDFAQGGGRTLTVTNVASDSITATATDRSGATKTVTIKTSSSTQYSRAGKTVDRSSITAGTKIHVQGTKNSDGSISATKIEVALPGFHGAVSAISGTDITVKDAKDSTTHVIHTDSNTAFTQAGASSSLSAVTVGGQISAVGTLNSDGSLHAEAVRIVLPHSGGKITQISGSTVTVSERNGAATIHLSNSTTYKSVTFGSSGPAESAASVSDLAVGKYIVAEGTKNSDGSLNAETVRILPAAAAGKVGGHWGGPRKHGTPSATSGANASALFRGW